ncbi:hypothetical protein DRP05_00415 [Archaeoglobales archaeon]|nr:MAG: hypothetical protein DRP05_00415 [Archaeoglobales archaeon]
MTKHVYKKNLRLIWGLMWGISYGAIFGIFADWIEQSFYHLLIIALLSGFWGAILMIVVEKLITNGSGNNRILKHQ